MDKAWEYMSSHLYEIQLLFGGKIHALVLMPNHLHLILTVPNEDLGIVMQRYVGSVTRTLNLISGRTGRVFGGRYHWTLIDSERYYACVYKYVYRNPVKAGLCARVEDYPFSTLAGLLGSAQLPIPLHYPWGRTDSWPLPDELGHLLDWLNRPFNNEADSAIRRALKRTQFGLYLPSRAQKISELIFAA